MRNLLRAGVLLLLMFHLPMTGEVARAAPTPPGELCRVSALAKWSNVEKWVWTRVCGGRSADLREFDRDHKNLNPRFDNGWTEARKLSPTFLETILLYEPWRSAQTRKGVQIVGAWFDENLDLAAGELPYPLWLDECRFTGEVTFSRTKTASLLSLRGSAILGTLDFAGAAIGSDLLMNKGAEFGKVDLSDANVGGQLQLDGTTVTGKLDMDSTVVGHDLVMYEGTFAEVELLDANVGGQLSLRGATVTGTLDMDSLVVRQSVFMNKRAAFEKVRLLNAKIGGELDLEDATVTGTLDMDGAVVGKSLFLRRGHFAKIEIIFAKLGGSLDMRGASVADVELEQTRVGAQLVLASSTRAGLIKWRHGAKLVLRNTQVNAFQDDPMAWPEHLDLKGFTYGHLGGIDSNAGVDVEERGSEWFSNWLRKDEPYSPQPYWQLAKVLTDMGHSEEASDVLYAGRERGRQRALDDGHIGSWVGQSLLKWTIGYGYGSGHFRALYWVLALIGIGWMVIRVTGQHRVPAPEGQGLIALGPIYVLDMLLPIIRLREVHYKIELEGIPRYYFYFHKLMGYILGSFLVAGVSGLTK